MSGQVITNPAAALRQVSDFTTMRDDGGEAVHQGKTVYQFECNAAVSAGDALELVVPTTTVTLRVTPTAASGADFVGIAEEAGAAGDIIDVVVGGLAFATVGTGGVTAGSAVDAVADGVADEALDATDVVGTIVGVALATASATETAPIWVKHL